MHYYKQIPFVIILTLLSIGTLTSCTQSYNGGFTILPQEDTRPVTVKSTNNNRSRNYTTPHIKTQAQPIQVVTSSPNSEHSPHIPVAPAATSNNTASIFTSTPPATNPINNFGEITGNSNITSTQAINNLSQISFTRAGSDFDVAISPKSEFVYYASTQHSTTSNIYRKRVNGNTLTQITNDSANDVMPSVSPDGSAIAFCSDRSGNWDIYIKVGSQKPVQLTNSPTHELHPSWSPDGKWIAFCSLSQHNGLWEIIVVDVNNPAERHIIGNGLFPEFSPIGDKIVFQRARQRDSREFGLWTLDFVNGEALRPTEIASSTNSAIINPTWSPDGKRIAFATIENPASQNKSTPRQANLWVINVDGSQRVRLTSDHFVNTQPAWGDNNNIYFISNRSGFDNIWSVRPGGGKIISAGLPSPINEENPQVNVPTD